MTGPMNGPTNGPTNGSTNEDAAQVTLAERVAWLDWAALGALHTDVAYASTLPDGPPVVLPGTARVVFLAAAQGGTLGELTARVAEESGQPVEAIADDVAAFVEALVGLGILARH